MSKCSGICDVCAMHCDSLVRDELAEIQSCQDPMTCENTLDMRTLGPWEMGSRVSMNNDIVATICINDGALNVMIWDVDEPSYEVIESGNQEDARAWADQKLIELGYILQ